MTDDIVTRLRDKTVCGPDLDAICEEAADEIVRLRAEVELKADYAERMDALAEERLIGWNAERAKVERLRVWIDRLEPIAGFESRLCPICRNSTEYRFWREPEVSDLTDRLRDTTYETDVCHEAAAVLDAIDALHGEHNTYDWYGIDGPQHLDLCGGCGERWPCPTHLLLHPEEEA